MTMTMNPPAGGANAAKATNVTKAANATNATNATNTMPAGKTTNDKDAKAPAGLFARMIAPADEAAPAQPTTDATDQTATTADGTGQRSDADTPDTELMRALDALLGRGPGEIAGNEAAALGAVGALGEGQDGASGKTDPVEAAPEDEQLPAGSPPVTLLSMLMPTLLPTAMPPAPAATTDGSSPTGAATAQSSTASALATDPARLLSLQAQGVPAGDADVATINPATVSAPADGAWQGLQRWSADLMAAMTPAATATTVPMTGAEASASGAATTLSLPASRDAWQQPLLQALGDRLQVQIAQRSDSARLHLEPPQLGRIEIDIRQQGGALQVQLSASHDEVRQQLRQIADPLRHELVQRHAGEVSVQVASGAQAAGDGRGRDGASGQSHAGGQPRDAQRQPGRALDGDEDKGSSGSGATAFADALAGNTRNTR